MEIEILTTLALIYSALQRDEAQVYWDLTEAYVLSSRLHKQSYIISYSSIDHLSAIDGALSKIYKKYHHILQIDFHFKKGSTSRIVCQLKAIKKSILNKTIKYRLQDVCMLHVIRVAWSEIMIEFFIDRSLRVQAFDF